MDSENSFCGCDISFWVKKCDIFKIVALFVKKKICGSCQNSVLPKKKKRKKTRRYTCKKKKRQKKVTASQIVTFRPNRLYDVFGKKKKRNKIKRRR